MRHKPPERDFLVTAAELAECVGRDRSRIAQLTGEGVLTPDSPGRYDLRTAMKEYVGYLDDKNRLHQLKVRKIEMENEILSTTLQRTKGEVLPVAEVEKAWADILLTVRQRILRIANKVSPRLPFCKSEVEMEKEIQSEVEEALTELTRPPVYQKMEANERSQDRP